MNKINNKGFTLVELMTTIVLLAIVMSIGGYSIIAIINNAKEKDYKLLIRNINSAVEVYYQECKYGDISEIIECPDLTQSKYANVYDKDGNSTPLTLGHLVKYGYLTGNVKDEGDLYSLVNTKTNQDISGCKIRFMVKDGKVIIESVTNSYYGCPSTKEYKEA